MTTYRQDPPNAVQVELVEGCSLSCQFCGVQGIREKRGQYKFMTRKTAEHLVEMLRGAMANDRWNPRIEFAMHGEPTVHPQLIGMVRMFGELSPRELILVSNGTGFVKNPDQFVSDLVEAGITSVCLDQYDGCEFVPKFLSRYTGPTPVHNYDGDKAQKFRGASRSKPYIVVKRDVSHLTKPFDKLNTHCGAGGPPQPVNPAMNKRCAKPFRELSIRWDGNVALCCNDFRGIYKIGNIAEFSGLDDLWQCEGFNAARRMLLHYSREFTPCRWCDALSPRVGLLPDKYGKTTLPEPDAGCGRVIDSAIAGPSYTEPVLRGWETSEPCVVELDVRRVTWQPLDKEKAPVV